MSCDIILKYPNKSNLDSSRFSTNMSREELNQIDIVDYLANQILSLDSSRAESLINTIQALLNKVKLDRINAIEYKQNGDLVPNYSGEQLKAEFPDVEWGKVPDNILLVSNGAGIVSDDYMMCTRVLCVNQDKPVFIVPKKYIKSFANYTKLLQILDKEDLELPTELQNLKDLIKRDSFDEDVIRIRKDKEKFRDKRIKDLEKTISELTTSEKGLKGKKKLNSLNEFIYKALKISSDSEIEQALKVYKQLESKRNIATLEQKLQDKYVLEKDVKRQLDKFQLELQKMNENPNYCYDESGTWNAYINSESQYTKQKSIPLSNIEARSDVAILKHIVEHANQWQASLSTQAYFQILDGLKQVLGYNSYHNTDDVTILTLDRIIKNGYRGNGTYQVKIKDLAKAFMDMGIADTMKHKNGVIDLLYKNYISKGNAFNLLSESTSEDTLMFKIKYNSLADSHDFVIGSDSLAQFKYKYKGFNVYNILTESGQTLWFADLNIVRGLDRTRSQPFPSEKDLKENLNERHLNIKLSYNHLFLNKVTGNDYTVVATPKSQKYSEGSIISTRDYKKGSIGIPYGYTKQQFINWVETTFSPQHQELILKLENDVESMALFYSYFGHTIEYSRNQNRYNIATQNLEKIVNDLLDYDKYPEIYYRVTSPSKLIDNKYNEIQIIREDPSIKQEVIETHSNPRILEYVSLQESFKERGIPIELLTSAQMKTKTGKDSWGFHSGGIIYLNTDHVFDLKTALHELSHLLLGQLKIYNPQLYSDLLLKFEKIQQKQIDMLYPRKAEEYKSQIKDLSENDKKIYILEEIFADVYAFYLQRVGVDNALFSEVSKATLENNPTLRSNDPAENLSKIINQNYTNPLQFYKDLSDHVKVQNVGFGFNLDMQLDNQIDEFIKNNLSDDLNNGIIQECD